MSCSNISKTAEVYRPFIALLQLPPSCHSAEVCGIWVQPQGITRHVTIIPASSVISVLRSSARAPQCCWTVQTKTHILFIQKRSEGELLSETDKMVFSSLQQGWVPQMVHVRGPLSQNELAQTHIERGGFQAVFQGNGTMKIVFNDSQRRILTPFEYTIDPKQCSREFLERNIQSILSLCVQAAFGQRASSVISDQDGLSRSTVVKRPDGVFQYCREILHVRKPEKISVSLHTLATVLEKMDAQRSPFLTCQLLPEGCPIQLTCSKQEDGSIMVSIVECSIKIARDESQENRKVLTKIYTRLLSGQRAHGKQPKPALPLLVQEAQEKGRASVWVADGSTIRNIVLIKTGEATFRFKCFDAEITADTLAYSELSEEDKVFVLSQPKTLLQHLFSKEMIDRQTRTAEIQFCKEGKKYPYLLLQLHVKPDSTVSLGVGKLVGKGGFKVVYKMSKTLLKKQTYALSRTKQREQQRMFSDEAEDLEKFQHPNILRIKKYVKTKQLAIVRMAAREKRKIELRDELKTEFCDVGDLQTMITKKPPDLAQKIQILEIIRDAARGVAYIHAYRKDTDPTTQRPITYAHTDIKPRNIFVKKEGERLVGKVGDLTTIQEGRVWRSTFGYTDWDSSSTCTTSQASDVWALGMSLFECLYQENPFDDLDERSLTEGGVRQAHEQLFRMLGDSPEALLIRQMLTWDRSLRPKLTAEFLEGFESVIRVFKPRS